MGCAGEPPAVAGGDDGHGPDRLPQQIPELVSRRGALLWALGLLLVAAIAIVVLRRSDIENFVELAERAQPAWLILGLVCQTATYLCAAAVWWLALRRLGHPLPLRRLAPLGLAKLFADEAVPSVGVGGSLLVVAALGRRGVPGPTALATFFFGVASFFIALVIAALGALILAGRVRDLPEAMEIGVFGLIAALAAIAAMLAWLLSRRRDALRRLLGRRPRLVRLLDASAHAARELGAAPRLLAGTTALQLVLRGLDGLTLWFCFLAIGITVPYATAFAGVALGSVAMFVVPLPMGLASFEAGAVGALVFFGLPAQAALAATLLFRGLSLWLPRLPGFLISQHELRAAAAGAAPR